MPRTILILDDCEKEGKKIQYNFRLHGVPVCYRYNYLSESLYSVIILIGHTEKYILKNIVEIRRKVRALSSSFTNSRFYMTR